MSRRHLNQDTTNNIFRILLIWVLSASSTQAFSVERKNFQKRCSNNFANASRGNHYLLFAADNEQNSQEHSPGTSLLQSTTILSRRNALGVAAAVAVSTPILPAVAADQEDDQYVQKGNGFAYRFVYPPDFEPGGKPLKTHLFEINWKSTNLPKYTFGVTIDPVRISSLKEFGTPEEVAAKVVTAEVNRDGVFEVTLVNDPVAVEEDGVLSYILNYLSVGKRGDKRFVAKFCIQNQRLYALTGQIAEADYKSKEKEIFKAVESFRVLS